MKDRSLPYYVTMFVTSTLFMYYMSSCSARSMCNCRPLNTLLVYSAPFQAAEAMASIDLSAKATSTINAAFLKNASKTKTKNGTKAVSCFTFIPVVMSNLRTATIVK